jgi:hypothetical protein
MVLLELAKVLKGENKFNVSIINYQNRGPDLDKQLSNYNTINLFDKNLNEVNNVHDLINSIYLADPLSRFFINTLTLSSFTKILKQFDFSYITWAHELELSWAMIGIDNVKNQLRNSEMIIVDSDFLKEQILKLDIGKKIEYLENGISYKITTQGGDLRKAFGLSENDILITIAGSRSMRKGFDLFPYFVHRIVIDTRALRENIKIKIIWIGAIESYDLNFYVNKQLNELVSPNLEVVVLNSAVNYENYVNASNYFISLAREDSAPQTLFLAQNLNIANLSINTSRDSEHNVYDEIDLISKSISLIPFFEYNGGKAIGSFSTWNSFLKKLNFLIEKDSSE